MNRYTGIILALALGTAAGACASAGAGGPTADGFEPKDNSYTKEASQSLAMAMIRSSDEEKRQLFQSALENAQMAIQEDSANPRGWYVAGQAYANLGQYQEADAAWDKAEELYPAYAEELVGDRETAWVQAYNEGVQAIQQDDIDTAIELMEAADAVYQGRPEAKLQLGVIYARRDEIDKAIGHYRSALEVLRATPAVELDSAMQESWAQNEEIAITNLAQLLASSGREAEAEQVYREVLEKNPTDIRARVNLADVLSRQGKADEANALYDELIERDDLSFADYINIGVGLFQAEKHEAAADAFAQAVRVNPYSRDAYYNLAQALFVQADKLDDALESATGAEAEAMRAQLIEIHTELAGAADKVLELDPYNRNILAYQARAYQALTQLDSGSSAQYRQRIQAALERHESAPFEMVQISLMPGSNGVTINGQVMNLKLQAGEPIRIRFTLMGSNGASIGSDDVTVTAAAANATSPFSVDISTTGDLAGWKYELVQ